MVQCLQTVLSKAGVDVRRMGADDQRLYLGDHFRALHQHQTHRLPVCPAGGQPHGLYNIVHHILRHGLLCKPAGGGGGRCGG